MKIDKENNEKSAIIAEFLFVKLSERRAADEIYKICSEMIGKYGGKVNF